MNKQEIAKHKSLPIDLVGIFRKSFLSGGENLCLTIIKIGIYLILTLPLTASYGFLMLNMEAKVYLFRILVEIMAIAWTWLILFYPEWRKPWRKIHGISKLILVFIALFMLSALLSTIISVDPSFSFFSDVQRGMGFLTVSHVFLFFAILFTVFNAKSFISLFKFSVIVSLGVSFFAIIQNNFAVLMNTQRIQGTMDYPSFFAAYLIFNIFFAFLVASDSKRKQERLIYYLISAILIITLVFAGIRGAMVGFAAGILVSFLLVLISTRFNPFQRKNLRKPYVLGIILLAILSVGLIVFTYTNKNSVWVTKTPLKYLSKITLSEGSRRITVWKLSYNAFKEKPIIGWGIENFDAAYAKYYDPKLYEGEGLSRQKFDKAHNVLVDTSVTQGLLGVISYIGIFGLSAFGLYRSVKDRKVKERLTRSKTLRSPPLAASFLVGLLVAYLVQNLFVFDTVTSYFLFFLLLVYILKINIASESTIKKTKIQAQSKKTVDSFPLDAKYWKLPLFIIFSLPIIYFIWLFNLSFGYSSHLFVRAVQISNQGDYKKALPLYEKSLKTSHIEGAEIDDNLINVTTNVFKKGSSDLAWQYFYLVEMREKDKISSKIYPYLYLANIYETASDKNPKYLDPAVKYYEDAILLSPKQLFIYYDLANLYADKHLYNKAYTTLDRVRSFDPEINPETNRHYFETALREENKERAFKELENMRAKISRNNSIADKSDAFIQVLLESSRGAVVYDRTDLFRDIIDNNYHKYLEAYANSEGSKTDTLFKIVLININLKEKEQAKKIAKRIVVSDPESKADIDGVLKAIDSLK